MSFQVEQGLPLAHEVDLIDDKPDDGTRKQLSELETCWDDLPDEAKRELARVVLYIDDVWEDLHLTGFMRRVKQEG